MNLKDQEKKTYNKVEAIKLFNNGKGIRDISRNINTPYSTVYKWIKKYKETNNLNDVLKRRSGQGRKTIVTKRAETKIKKLMEGNVSLTYKEVSKELKKSNINISKNVIARYLKSKGKKYSPKANYLLSNDHRRKRNDFCNNFKESNAVNDAIFSDEFKIDLNLNKRRFYRFTGAPKRARIRFNPNYSLMVWGAISIKGKISLAKVNGKLNGDSYINILENNLINQANSKHDHWKFQQDNATCHKSIHVMRWFREKRIELVNHPPRSPDLNPIESIWSLLKRKVAEESPKNQSTLEEAIFKSWNSINNKTIKKTIKHLSKVCNNVLLKGGGYVD